MFSFDTSIGSIYSLNNSIYVDKLFMQTLFINAKALDKVFLLDLGFFNKGLFLYFFIYKYFVVVILMALMVNTFKSYRDVFKNKDFLTLSAFNSWYRVDKDKMHKLTMKELK